MAENSAGYAVMFAMMAAHFMFLTRLHTQIYLWKNFFSFTYIQEREENIRKEEEYLKLREKLKKRIKDTSDDD